MNFKSSPGIFIISVTSGVELKEAELMEIFTHKYHVMTLFAWLEFSFIWDLALNLSDFYYKNPFENQIYKPNVIVGKNLHIPRKNEVWGTVDWLPYGPFWLSAGS